MTDQHNTDEPRSAARRCVEITTDEHGSVRIAFVPVGPTRLFITTTINHQPKKENCHD